MKAFEYFHKSIEITEEIGEKNHLGVRYANIGSIYEVRGKFDKALEEYKKAVAIERSQQNLNGIATQLNNIAGILGDLGKYDDCIKKYSESLGIMENLKIKPGIARALNNLGSVYYKFKKDHTKAIPLLERSLELYKELNDSQMISSTQQNLDFIKKQLDTKN